MELLDLIVKNYTIKSIIRIGKVKNGSGNTYLVETKQEKYIAKANERNDFINIYEKVQRILNQKNLLQSKIIRTNEGLLMTPEGVVLYEFINGDIYRALNKYQFENAIKYIKKYNEALNDVPFNEDELDFKNHWDKAKSIDFTVNKFPDILPGINIDVEYKTNIYNAIDILQKNKGKISAQKSQLIHSDLGADNFIFNGDEVISIIDFIPEYSPELYSLCQFFYWNYFWDNQYYNRDEMNGYLKIYNFNGDNNIEPEIFQLLLIKAALYRIVGPLMDITEKDIKDYNGLKKRFFILDELLSNLI